MHAVASSILKLAAEKLSLKGGGESMRAKGVGSRSSKRQKGQSVVSYLEAKKIFSEFYYKKFCYSACVCVCVSSTLTLLHIRPHTTIYLLSSTDFSE